MSNSTVRAEHPCLGRDRAKQWQADLLDSREGKAIWVKQAQQDLVRGMWLVEGRASDCMGREGHGLGGEGEGKERGGRVLTVGEVKAHAGV